MGEKPLLTLFRKGDTTLVYIASADYAKKIAGPRCKPGERLYIHVDRAYGRVLAYTENDITRVISPDMDDLEFILSFCEKDLD